METTCFEGPVEVQDTPEVLLLDCYMELLAYSAYLVHGGEDAAPAYEDAVGVFENLLARSEETARDAGFSRGQWQEGFFPVCAYIDETLMCSGWPGRMQWEGHQFQRRFFNTTTAGWLFFDRLDDAEALSADVRAVYEFCLALGFKGRYFRTSDTGKMDDIKYSQLKGVTDNVDLVYPDTPFPEAYESENAANARKANRWKRISLMVPVAVLVPLAIFTALYVLFDRLLDNTIAQYFKAVF